MKATVFITLTKFSNGMSFNLEDTALRVSGRAEGYIWNTDSDFNFKECSIKFYSGEPDEWMSEFQKEHNRRICGFLTAASGLKTKKVEKYEDFHDDLFIPPVEAYIRLESKEAISRIADMFSTAIAGNRKISGAGLDKYTYRRLANVKKTKQIKCLQAKQAAGIVCRRGDRPNGS